MKKMFLVWGIVCGLMLTVGPMSATGHVAADSLCEVVIASVTNALADAEDGSRVQSDAEEMLEYLERLRHRPLNLNSATKTELGRLMLLSDFQIRSLQDYISEHGAVLSFAELSLIHGFTERLAERLRPFVYLGERGAGSKPFADNCHASFYTKYYHKLDWLAENSSQPKGFKEDYLQMRLRASWADKMEMFLLTDKDMGESLGSFNSFSLAAHQLKLYHPKSSAHKGVTIEDIVLGNVAVRFGQGLTLWNSLSFSGVEDTYGYLKRGAPISLYTSSDEERYLWGVGTTLSYYNTTLSIIGSYIRAEASAASNLHQLLTGAHISHLFRNIRVGFSYAGYTYAQKYDGFQTNFATDVYAVWGAVRLFAEAAVSNGSALAFLAGGTLSAEDYELHFLFRGYSPEYISPYAGAYSTISNTANQRGASLRVSKKLSNSYSISAGADYTFYPYYRYNIKGSSSATKLFAQAGWNKDPLNLLWLRISYKLNAAYTEPPAKNSLLALRLNGKRQLWSWCGVALRGEYNIAANKSQSSSAYALQLSVSLSFWNSRIKGHIGFVDYNAAEWSNRIYLAEPDLPQTFSSNLLYKRGGDVFAIVHIKPVRRLSIHLKLQQRKQVLTLKTGLQYNF